MTSKNPHPVGPRIPSLLTAIVSTFLVLAPARAQDQPQDDVQARVGALLQRSCTLAGCHAGPAPQQGMVLTADSFFTSVVGVPSVERPALQRVHPGMPDSSYLVLKLKGAEGIEGAQMPLIGDHLTDGEVALIEEWITSLGGEEAPEGTQSEGQGMAGHEAGGAVRRGQTPASGSLE